ncbi:MAG: cofactor-independent phosphoglycerate mutase [SAR324 cluster bacterium]|nr:cofactor-independent phosphoglycerate mutase [SAR324 cluster bacterium]
MKYVIIQGDGMSDLLERPQSQDTPLEAARTPHFDRVAGCGLYGLIHTIPEGMPPGSDVGNLSLFGYDPRQFYTGRSPLEAAAMGVKLGPEDVAFRMNLVTLRGDAGGEEMADFSGGHIDSDSAAVLVGALGDALGDESFQFYAGVSYRHLLVWRKGREDMSTTPPHDISDRAIAPHFPQGEGAAELNRIMEASRELLAGHPLNAQRRAAGQPPISMVWLWGQGKVPSMPVFRSLYQLRGAAISAVDLVRGVAVYAGFDVVPVPGATGFLDTDYAAKGKYALRALEDHDLVFLHIEAPDEAGHMGDREEKIKAIEAIDGQIVGPLLDGLAALGPFKILITSDHATPISLRTHCADPVPFAMASAGQLDSGGGTLKYGERTALASGVVISDGHSIIDRLLAWPE